MIEVKDNRRQLSAVEREEPQPPGWWPELVSVDAELHQAAAKFGEPTEQGNLFTGFGNETWANLAAEFKRQNDARVTAGKPGVWQKVILEEVYEAFEIEATAENANRLHAELIQAAAMCVAAAEDVRVKLSASPPAA